MTTSVYFNHIESTPEQNLHQDLIIEAIKNYGIDYISRNDTINNYLTLKYKFNYNKTDINLYLGDGNKIRFRYNAIIVTAGGKYIDIDLLKCLIENGIYLLFFLSVKIYL